MLASEAGRTQRCTPYGAGRNGHKAECQCKPSWRRGTVRMSDGGFHLRNRICPSCRRRPQKHSPGFRRSPGERCSDSAALEPAGERMVHDVRRAAGGGAAWAGRKAGQAQTHLSAPVPVESIEQDQLVHEEKSRRTCTPARMRASNARQKAAFAATGGGGCSWPRPPYLKRGEAGTCAGQGWARRGKSAPSGRR